MPIFEMDIDAKTAWVNTGLSLDGTLPVTIQAVSGTWTANPATGLVDADGHDGLIAKPGYNLPGEVEGLLVGRIQATGGDVIFRVGKSHTIDSPPAGPLTLSINDDINAVYGEGFPDNEGSVHVRITIGT